MSNTEASLHDGGMYVYQTGPCKGWVFFLNAQDWVEAADMVALPGAREIAQQAYEAVSAHPAYDPDVPHHPRVACIPTQDGVGLHFFMWRTREGTLVVSPVRLPWLDWTNGHDDDIDP